MFLPPIPTPTPAKRHSWRAIRTIYLRIRCSLFFLLWGCYLLYVCALPPGRERRGPDLMACTAKPSQCHPSVPWRSRSSALEPRHGTPGSPSWTRTRGKATAGINPRPRKKSPLGWKCFKGLKRSLSSSKVAAERMHRATRHDKTRQVRKGRVMETFGMKIEVMRETLRGAV